MKQPTLALLLLAAATASAAPSKSASADLQTSGQQRADLLIASLGIGNSQFLLRSPRRKRMHDVPQIECPPADDGMEKFACPTPDRMVRYRCIEGHVLCDGFLDCPNGEDEDRQSCMFYKALKAQDKKG